MDTQRHFLYKQLATMVGRTPLVEIRHWSLPNNCRVSAKLEFLNPSGSHHDRQYLALFQEAEETGRIQPGQTPLIEVTSGCAGASFAWFAQRLGYTATVLVPAELPAARVAMITQYDCQVERVSGYIPGCINRLHELLANNRSCPTRDRLYCLNHTRSSVAAHALAAIATEALETNQELSAYVATIGSGSSLVGPGQVFAARQLAVFAWEPWASAVAYDLQNPGAYWKQFHCHPGTYPHEIWGASFAGVDFPHVAAGIKLLTDKIVLVSDQQQNQYCLETSLPCWDVVNVNWPIGRSSLASLAAVQVLARTHHNHNFLVICYDAATNY